MALTSIALTQKLADVEKRIHWVNCPFCDEQWTKLRKCVYYRDGRPVDSSVCVECAETAYGLQYMPYAHKMPGVEVSVMRHPNFEKLGQKYHSKSQLIATISYGETRFVVKSKGSGLLMREANKPDDMAKFYDNTFQVWFAFRNELDKEPEPVLKGWGR